MNDASPASPASPAPAYRSVFSPRLMAGRVVLVTGGGTGIGRCTAHELASLGAHVVLVGRRLEPLQATAGEIVADAAGGPVSTPATSAKKKR